MPEQKDKEKIIIIGAGPAGYTAAIYAARAGLSPLMITGTLEGGQITETQELGNWPGEPEPITGFDLMDKMKKQAAGYGVRFQNDTVLAIARHDGTISLQCEKGTAEAEAVIISTGASPRRLSINGEAEFWGQGVSSCATCDGFFYRKKRTAVIGGGNTAVLDAIYLAGLCREVHLIHRRDGFRCDKYSLDRMYALAEQGKITLHLGYTADEILGTQGDGVTGIRIKSVTDGKTLDIACDGVFEAIGHIPSTKPFPKEMLDEKGYIVTGKDETYRTMTAIPGVFAAGDCCEPVYKQAILAAGDGCRAALEAESWLGTQRQ